MEKIRSLGFVAFWLVLCVTASASRAQSNFERGLEAARQQDWGSAIEAFSDAHAAQRDDPAVLVNLGNAHAQAGHLLTAIAYLGASLAVSPQPAELHEQQDGLRAADEVRWRGVIKLALETADSIEDDEERRAVLEEIALMQARLGDIEEALRTLPETAPAWRHRSVWFEFAIARAAAGEAEATNAAVGRIGDGNLANEVHRELYRYWLAVGNWAGARAEVEALAPESFWGEERDSYLARIAERRARGADGLIGDTGELEKWIEIAETSFPEGPLWGELASLIREDAIQGAHPDRDLEGALRAAEAAPTPQEHVLRLVSTERSVLDQMAYPRMLIHRLANGLAWREANPDWRTRD